MAMSTQGQIELKECKFLWKIENFSKLCSNVKDFIVSPIFQMNDLRCSQWILHLYPFGDDENSQGMLTVLLCNKSSVKVNTYFELILSDVNGVEIVSRKACRNFGPSESWGWHMFKRDSLLQLKDGLFSDILNIGCNIHMDIYSDREVQIDKEILGTYESLFYNEDFSDLTVVIQKQRMKVHKNILSARSPVFKAMLHHNMKENNTSTPYSYRDTAQRRYALPRYTAKNNTQTITITDVSYNIMKQVLLFIYSGKVNDLKENAKVLLPVANKYEIKDLAVLCEKSILKNIQIEDACESLSMAHRYNCSELKDKVIQFIIPNINEIKETTGFKILIRSNPELFEELFARVAPLINKI